MDKGAKACAQMSLLSGAFVEAGAMSNNSVVVKATEAAFPSQVPKLEHFCCRTPEKSQGFENAANPMVS